MADKIEGSVSYTIQLPVEEKSTVKGIDEITKHLEQLQNSFAKLELNASKTFGATESVAKNVEKSFKVTNSTLDSFDNKFLSMLQRMQKSAGTTDGEINSFVSTFDKLKANLKSAGESGEGVHQAFASMNQLFQRTTLQLRENDTAFKNNRDAIKGVADALRSMRSADVQKVFPSTNQMETLNRAFDMTVEKLQQVGASESYIKNVMSAFEQFEKRANAGFDSTSQLTLVTKELTSQMNAMRTAGEQYARIQNNITIAMMKAENEAGNVIKTLREMGGAEDKIEGVSAALQEYRTAMRDAGGDTVKTQSANLKFRNAINGVKEDISVARREADAYKQSIENMSKSFQIALGPLSGVASRITSLGSLFKANGAVIGLAVASITGLSVASYAMVRAGMELERQLGQINAIIRITGREAEVTSYRLVEMARNVGEATLASTAEATKAITALTTMRGIDSSMFEGILTAAQGMSEMFGGGIAENSKRIGKALSDVSKAGEVLREVGISLTQTETAVLQALQATGKQADAQAIIMSKLTTFQESAAGSASGLAGVIDTLMERIGVYWQEVSIAANATGGFGKELTVVSDLIKQYTEEQTRLYAVAEILGGVLSGVGTIIAGVAKNFDLLIIGAAGLAVGALTKSFIMLGGAMLGGAVKLKAFGVSLLSTIGVMRTATATTATLGATLMAAAPWMAAIAAVGYLAYEMFTDVNQSAIVYQRTMDEFSGRAGKTSREFEEQTRALMGLTEAQRDAIEVEKTLLRAKIANTESIGFYEAFGDQIDALKDSLYELNDVGLFSGIFNREVVRETVDTYFSLLDSSRQLFNQFKEGKINAEQLNAEFDKLIKAEGLTGNVAQSFFDLKKQIVDTALVIELMRSDLEKIGEVNVGEQNFTRMFDGLKKGYADVLPVFAQFDKDILDVLTTASLTSDTITGILNEYEKELTSAAEKLKVNGKETEAYARAMEMVADKLSIARGQLQGFGDTLNNIRFQDTISMVEGFADTLKVYDVFKAKGKDAADALRQELDINKKLADSRELLKEKSIQQLRATAKSAGLVVEEAYSRESLVEAIVAQQRTVLNAENAMKAANKTTKEAKDEAKSLRDALTDLATKYRQVNEQYGAYVSGGNDGLALVETNQRIVETVDALFDKVGKLKQADVDKMVASWAKQFDQLNLEGMSTEEVVRAVAEALVMKDVDLGKLKEADELFKSVSKSSNDLIEELKRGEAEYQAFLSGGEEGLNAAKAASDAKKAAEQYMKEFSKITDDKQRLKEMTKWAEQFPETFGDAGTLSAEAFANGVERKFASDASNKLLIESVRETADKIEDVFAQSFQSIFANGIDGFSDMMDGFKSLFMNMLATLIAEAAKNQIILPLVTGYQTGAAGGGGIAGGLSGMASAAGSLGPGAIAAIGAAVTVATVSSFNKSQDKKFEKLTAEYRQATQSTGTVLGDINAKSDSIGNTLESISEYSEDVLSVNYGMYKALVDIRNGIQATATGFAREMANTGPLAQGSSARTSNFTKSLVMGGNAFGLTQLGFDEGDIMTTIAGGFVGLGVDKLLGGVTSDFLGGIVNSVSKAIYSKKREVVDTGIRFMGQSVGDIMADGMVEALQYATIVTTRRTVGVKTSKTNEATEAIDSVLARQFGDIFIAGIDSLQQASEVFGMRLSDEFVKSLTIPLQNLSLKDLKGEELAAEIERFFSATLDNWAEEALGHIEATLGLDFEFLQRFQNEGEGAYQTMLRLAAETNQLSYNLERLGQSVGLVGAEMIVFTQELANIAGGFSELNTLQSTFFDQFFSETQKIGVTVDGLARAFEQVGVAVPLTREAFTQLVQSLDLLSESGQEAYVQLLQLAGAVDVYFDRLEKAEEAYREKTGDAVTNLVNKMAMLNKEFTSLGLVAPTSVAQFEAIVNGMDRTTEAGRRLYASMMVLSESFFAVQDSAEQMRTDETNRLQQLRDEITRRYDDEVDGYKRIQKIIVDGYKQIGRVSKTPDLGFFDKQIEDAFAAFTGGSLASTAEQAERIQQAIQDRYDMELVYLESVRVENESIYGYQIASMEQLKRTAIDLKNYVDSLKLSDVSPLTPTQRLTEAEDQFERVLQRARMGDSDAISRLPGVADSYLDEARSYYASSDDYTNIFNSVTSELMKISDEFAGMEIPLDPVERAIGDLNKQTQENLERLIALTEEIAAPSGAPDTSVIDDLIKMLEGVKGESVQDIADALVKSGTFESDNADNFTKIAETLSKIESVQTALLEKESEMPSGMEPIYFESVREYLTRAASSTVDAMYAAYVRGDFDEADMLENSLAGLQAQMADLSAAEAAYTDKVAKLTAESINLQNQLVALEAELAFYIDGSHATGLASVPFDGYIAELHKGEAVLTAEQANVLRQGLNVGMSNEAVVAAVNVDATTQTENGDSNAVVSEIRNIMAEVVAIARRSEANSEATAEAAKEAAQSAREAAKAALATAEAARRTSEKVDVVNRTQKILGK